MKIHGFITVAQIHGFITVAQMNMDLSLKDYYTQQIVLELEVMFAIVDK